MPSSGLREGVLEAREFLQSLGKSGAERAVLAAWLDKRESSSKVLKALDHKKKKNGELVKLDIGLADIAQNVRNRTSSSSSSNSSKKSQLSGLYLTKDELVHIFYWKNGRGKARPNFKLIDSNKDSDVRTITAQAFLLVPSSADGHDWAASLDELVKLSGVGDATASAILQAIFPQTFPFMADEVIEVVVPEERRDYTRQIYQKLRDRLIEICHQLNEMLLRQPPAKPHSAFTVSDVGTCIWVAAMEAALGIGAPATQGESPETNCNAQAAGSKRKRK